MSFAHAIAGGNMRHLDQAWPEGRHRLHELGAGQHVAQIVVDLGHREAELGKAIFLQDHGVSFHLKTGK